MLVGFFLRIHLHYVMSWCRLTHWGRETHICVGKLTIIASDNGLSPERRQAIIWTNAGILLIRPLWTNFNKILIEIHTFSFKKIHLKMSSAKWRPFCLGLNVLSWASFMTPYGVHENLRYPKLVIICVCICPSKQTLLEPINRATMLWHNGAGKVFYLLLRKFLDIETEGLYKLISLKEDFYFFHNFNNDDPVRWSTYNTNKPQCVH